MNMKPSPLRHLDISDDALAADIATEKARQLAGAYDRIEQLQDAVRGLLVLISATEDNTRGVSEAVREGLRTDQRVVDAQELLR